MLSTVQTEDVCAVLPHSRSRSVLTTEACYRSHDDEHELVLAIDGVTRRHVLAIERGEVEFALVADGPGLRLCFRFGTAIPWSTAILEETLAPPEAGAVPLVSAPLPERRILIHVELVDARSRAVCATRNATVSLDFSRVLRSALGARLLFSRTALVSAGERNGFGHGPSRNELVLDHVLARSFGSD